MDITYLILKVLNRPLKWGTARLWTPTGFKNTSRQSWTFEKNLCFTTKTSGWWRPIQWKFRDVLYLILKIYSRSLKWGTVCLCTLTGSSLNFDFKKAVLHLTRLKTSFSPWPRASICVQMLGLWLSNIQFLKGNKTLSHLVHLNK